VKAGLLAFAMMAAPATQAAASSDVGRIGSIETFGQAAASCAAALQSGSLDLAEIEVRGWQRVDDPNTAQKSIFFHGEDHSVRITTTLMFGQMCIVDGHSESGAQTDIAGAVTNQIESTIGGNVTEYDGVIHQKNDVVMRTFFAEKFRIVLSIKTTDSAIMITMRPI